MNSISKKLETLINNEQTGHQNFANYSLKDITFLLRHFGNPHKKIKTIHIAGTNGKGSTAHMLNSIFLAAGYKTGLYTSPNLIRINERIKINNKEIPSQKLLKYVDELFEALSKHKNTHSTYFDALTLIAFRYFFEEKTDIAIIETGLGGRLDSTNVVSPLISIITNISKDHTGVLGNTINEIAWEKAGIIKKNSLTITSNTNKIILDILKKSSDQMMSDFYAFNRDFSVKLKNRDDQIHFDFIMDLKQNKKNNKSKRSEIAYSINDINIKIPGKFQITNASLAIAASYLLGNYGYYIGENEIKNGLKNTLIPGRLHVLCKKPLIIFDPAHNPNAMKATVAELKKIYPDMNYTVIISFMTDKDYLSLFRIIKKHLTNNIIYYELPDKRNFKILPGKFGKINPAFENIISVNNVDDLHKKILNSKKKNTLFFITGSFRLYSIARQLSKML